MPNYTEKLLNRELEDLHTAIPGRVESYDAATQKADVKPLVKANFFDDEDTRVIEPLPVITSVPVIFPGAGSFRFTFPINRGDFVLLVFSEASLDKWMFSGEDVDPEIYSRHELTDAIAIPGIRPFSTTTEAHSSAAVIEFSSELLLGSQSASDPVVRQSDLTALKVYIDAHLHSGVTTGAGTSGPPNKSPTVTGSPNVKLD